MFLLRFRDTHVPRENSNFVRRLTGWAWTRTGMLLTYETAGL